MVLGGCGYFEYEPLDRAALDAQVPDATSDGEAPDAGPACSAVSTADPCLSLPSLPVAPVIDGVVDCGLVPRAIAPEGWYSIGSAPIPDGVVARVAAAWRPDGIYFYVEVDTPSLRPPDAVVNALYCGDAPEVYVDSDGAFTTAPGYDAIGARQFLARGPTPGAGVETMGDVYRDSVRLNAWRAAGFATRTRPGGYALEAFVTSADLALVGWTLAAGQSVGIDVGVNVSSSPGTPDVDCGRRLGQFFLRSNDGGADPCFGRPYCDASAFCTPVLAP